MNSSPKQKRGGGGLNIESTNECLTKAEFLDNMFSVNNRDQNSAASDMTKLIFVYNDTPNDKTISLNNLYSIVSPYSYFSVTLPTAVPNIELITIDGGYIFWARYGQTGSGTSDNVPMTSKLFSAGEVISFINGTYKFSAVVAFIKT